MSWRCLAELTAYPDQEVTVLDNLILALHQLVHRRVDAEVAPIEELGLRCRQPNHRPAHECGRVLGEATGAGIVMSVITVPGEAAIEVTLACSAAKNCTGCAATSFDRQ